MDDVDVAAAMIRDASKVTVLTGAGISTDSGIPDFRGPQGVWTRDPNAERMATLRHYLADPAVREQAWRSRLDSPVWRADPNPGHAAIVRLERMGKLRALVTQNVDGLHAQAGNDPSLIFEVHGTIRMARCWTCTARWPMHEVLDRVRLGESDPRCDQCGGIIKSDAILFGQNLVPAVIDGAFAASIDCDVMLAVGSTLSVHPVADCVPRAKHAGARVIIVNAAPTEMDPIADVVLRGSISEELGRLIA